MITTLSLLSVSSHNYTVQPRDVILSCILRVEDWFIYYMVSYWKWNNGTGAQLQWWCQRGYIILFGCISLYIYDKSILNCCLGVRKSDWVKLLPSPSFNHHLYYQDAVLWSWLLSLWSCPSASLRVESKDICIMRKHPCSHKLRGSESKTLL